MRVDCWRREDGESGEPLSTEALTKGLSEPWREAVATVGQNLFCAERGHSSRPGSRGVWLRRRRPYLAADEHPELAQR
eukprot:509647-Prymnesium_polylepis.1